MDGLARALAEFGQAHGDAGLDAEQILDLLWLSRDPPPAGGQATAPSGRAAPESRPPTDGGEGTVPALSTPHPATAPEPAMAPEPVYPGDTPTVPVDEGAWGPGDRTGPLIPVSDVGFRGARPLRDALELARALRPFRRAVRPGPLEPDEDATAQATAEAWVSAALSARTGPRRRDEAGPRPLVVVTHRRPVRALDVALVVDAGSSMGMWDRAFTQLEHVFVQSGAFRAVSRWGLVQGGGGSQLVDAGGARHPPGRLRDPSGRRLVLLASDAVGDHWYRPGVWRTIESWAAVMPTALLHLLPRRYWGESAIGEPDVRMRLGSTPGLPVPNASYQVERGWWVTGAAGLPLPVVRLGPAGLSGWAEAATTGAAWVEGVSTAAVGTGAPQTPSEYNRGLRDRDGQLLAAFLRRASPRAVHLAQILSCAPTLSPQLIEILQERLAPETGLEERAEIFVSGLLEPAGRESYQFLPTAVAAFREQVGHLEELAAFRVASDHLQRNFGLGGDVRTLVPHPDGTFGIAPQAEPFAQLQRNMADRLAALTGPGYLAPPQSGQVKEPGEGMLLPQARPHSGGLSRPASQERALSGAAAVPRERTAPASNGLAALPAPAAALAEQVAGVDGDGRLTVLDIGADGITRYRLHRDAMGTPHARRLATDSWDAAGVTPAWIDHLAGGPGPLAVIRTAPAGVRAADRAAALLRDARPHAESVAVAGADVADLLRGVIEREPIRQPYSLIALEPGNGSGRLRLTTVPLFAPGAVRNDSVPLSLRCEPGGEGGTAFAVGAHGPDGRFRVMSVRSARIRAGHHDLVALLRRPGLVRFGGLDGLAADRREWADIVAAIPDRYDIRPRPAHLVCLIEVSGMRERVASRLGRVDQLLMLLDWEVPADLTVSLVAYGRHDYGDRLGRRDRVPEILVWSADAATARAAVAAAMDRRPLPVTYPDAAMVEDALALVDERLPPEAGARLALLTVGDRPPHPPRVTVSEIHPCPHRRDWRGMLQRLEARPGTTLAAICDDPARRPEAPWRRLGGGAPPVPLDVVDVPRLAVELGLVPPMRARPPLPLVI